MCDIVDFIFETEPGFIKEKTLEDLDSTQVCSSCNVSENSILENSSKAPQALDIIKYADINDIWSILLLIQREKHKISLIFKLQKNTEIFRIHTNFLKTYLLAKSFKDTHSPFQQHLNPLTGEIHLSISFLIANHQQTKGIQQKQFFTKIIPFKNRIINYWQKVIAMTEGNFGVSENFLLSQKYAEINILALSSERENQAENVYNFKTYLPNTLKESDLCAQMLNFFPQQKRQPKQSQDFPYRKSLIQIFKNKKNYQQESARPIATFSNYEALNIDKKDKEILFNRVKSLKKDQIFKVEDIKFGKMFLTLVPHSKEILERLIGNLSSLNHASQHNFLNYYFLLNDSTRQEMFQMALKKLTLIEFLQKNANCLSFQKKLKIFTDLFYVVFEIWQRFDTFPGFFNINDFSITKTHVIKFDNVHKWRKLAEDEEDFVSDENRAFYRAEMMIRVQQIFKQMFFNTNLIKKSFLRNQKSLSKARNGHHQEDERVKTSQKRQELHFYGIQEILSPVMYCFQMYETVHNKNGDQKWSLQTEEFNFESRRNFRRGNLDLVFGTLSKSVELINSMI